MKLNAKSVTRAVFLSTALFIGTPFVRGQNLLTDPSFENKTAGPGANAPGGWYFFNGAAFSNVVTAQSGTEVNVDPGGGTTGAYQSISSGVAPGAQFLISGWALVTTEPVSGAGILQATFFSAANLGGTNLFTVASPTVAQAAPTVMNSSSPVNTWVFMSETVTAPTGAVSLGVYTLNQANVPVYYDNLSVTLIPEPSSIALAGVSFFFLLLHLRRRIVQRGIV